MLSMIHPTNWVPFSEHGKKHNPMFIYSNQADLIELPAQHLCSGSLHTIPPILAFSHLSKTYRRTIFPRFNLNGHHVPILTSPTETSLFHWAIYVLTFLVSLELSLTLPTFLIQQCLGHSRPSESICQLIY